MRIRRVFLNIDQRTANNVTDEFKMLMNDPDLEKSISPRGTLVFRDGGQFCVIGPDFVSMEESDCYAFGATKEEAILNYASKENSRRRWIDFDIG